MMEEVFVTHFHGRMSYTEALNLPVWWRRWFLARLKKEFEAMYPGKK